jgi:hypothetical protein
VRIHRFAKVLLLAPPIGSALVGVLGLVAGVVLLSRSTQFAGRALGRSDVHAPASVSPPRDPTAKERPMVQPVDASAAGVNPAGANPTSESNRDARSSRAARRASSSGLMSAHFRQVVFQKPIASNQLGFLDDYVGRPANDVVREQKLRELVNQVVPYAPFHLGLDMPLPHAVESMFSNSPVPVDIREGRYVMVTGMRGSNGRGRAFLWIDLQQGISLGGIFFYPSNGEPTPTLTIFSRQVNRQSLRMSQLPGAFVQDLSMWAASVGVPPITTRYFINASSEKTVLAHDEDLCKHVDGAGATSREACRQMKADAAQIDREASHFLNQTNYASNATMRMIADTPSLQAKTTP